MMTAEEWADKPTGSNDGRERPDDLVSMLREARADLEVYIGADYPQELRDKYPSVQMQWQRDMDLCHRIDAALASLEPKP